MQAHLCKEREVGKWERKGIVHNSTLSLGRVGDRVHHAEQSCDKLVFRYLTATCEDKVRGSKGWRSRMAGISWLNQHVLAASDFPPFLFLSVISSSRTPTQCPHTAPWLGALVSQQHFPARTCLASCALLSAGCLLSLSLVRSHMRWQMQRSLFAVHLGLQTNGDSSLLKLS